MEQNKILELLKNLISGNIQVEELSEIIDEWLFDLRQTPRVIPEQQLLSSLELFIHEAREGYRSWNELYEYVISIIQQFISETNSTTIILNTEAASELVTISGGSVPVMDYRAEMALA